MVALVTTSCAYKKLSKELELSNEKLFFEFSEPQLIKKAFLHKQAFLPNGSYRCYYKDEKGCFFEAPSTLNEEMMFSRGSTGGIYIIQTDPIQAFIFSQDKHPETVYTHGVGMVSFGGSGFYRIGDPLPNSIISKIQIQKMD